MPVPMTDGARSVTVAELAKHHASAGSSWLAIGGEVYDVTEFALDHPGGEDILLQLCEDVFGNYVAQRFFDCSSREQQMALADVLVGSVLRLSLNIYGCRVVQKALVAIHGEQQLLLIAELKGSVMCCIQDQNGNHVIQKCIECVATSSIKFIFEEISNQVAELARHGNPLPKVETPPLDSAARDERITVAVSTATLDFARRDVFLRRVLNARASSLHLKLRRGGIRRPHWFTEHERRGAEE